jgi:hypothetical protein
MLRWNDAGQPDHLSFAGLRKGGGGKGGSTETSGTGYSQGTSSTQLPSWVDQASQQALASGQALAAQPYQPYTGQLVAGTPADTQQAYGQVRNLQGQVDPAYNAASGQWGGVLGNLQSQTPDQINALTNQLYGNYQQGVVNPAAGLLGGYMSQGPATAGQVTSNALQIMSPFSQAVIDPALQVGRQQLQQNLQQIGAGANQAGAFGGSRQGVQEGVAQSQAAVGAGTMVGNLLNQGWQSALNPATNVALQGGAQGYGAANTLTGLLGSGYGASQQGAQGIANTNLGLGTSAAQQLPGLATSQMTADQQATAALQASGAAQQQQQQNLLNSQYGQFLEQRQYPLQQQEELLATLGGIPYGSTTNTSGFNMANQKAVNTPSQGTQILQDVGLAAGLLVGF